MNLTDYPPDVQAQIVRAGAHATQPALLAEEARLRNAVTDLDMARLLLALERGVSVVYKGYRWHCPDGSPIGRGLSATVSEGIRVGLVTQAVERTGPHTCVQRAVAAPVHLRSDTAPDRPACPQPTSYKRYRLMNREDMQYVDCLTCCSLA
jgi:hypothetical protein